MKLTPSAKLVYGFSAPTQVSGLLQASHSGDQTILADELTISGDHGALGSARHRHHEPSPPVADALRADALRLGRLRYCPVCDGCRATKARAFAAGTADRANRLILSHGLGVGFTPGREVRHASDR